MEFTLYGAYELDGFSQHKLRRARSFRRAGGLFHAIGKAGGLFHTIGKE